MGFLIWLASGVAAFVIARLLPARSSVVAETATALGAGVAGGVLATALDFGGWNQIDPRAALLAFLAAAAALGVLRNLKLGHVSDS